MCIRDRRTDLLNAWNKIAGGNIELINAYGPTETIITSSIYKAHEKTLDRNCLHIPIGRSIGNRDVFVIDDHGNILPPNVPGELCFSSDLLARGYQNNPSLTAERFVPDKYSDVNSGRMYLTGDMVRYGLDGYIEYLGRIDNQVKIRGYRIELSEIEKVLLEHENVKEAAVVVNSVNEEDESIIAYVIIQDDVNTDPDLISFCKTKLPNYMIPNHIVRIEKFPLTPNGKIDFRKLPVSQILDSAVASEYIAPRSELEAEIAAILSETLGKEKIGVKDNFFDLGGHSILAIKVVSKLRKSFGVELELKNLFENPTVEGLSSAIIMEQSKLLDDKELDSLLEQIENME
jgi:acyl carrier protein